MLKFPIWPGPGGQQALAEGGCLLSSKRHRAPGSSILTGRQQLHQPLGGPHSPQSCCRHSRPAPVPGLPGKRSASPTLPGSLTPGRNCGPELCSRARCVHFRTQECPCQRPAPGTPEVERTPASVAAEGEEKKHGERGGSGRTAPAAAYLRRRAGPASLGGRTAGRTRPAASRDPRHPARAATAPAGPPPAVSPSTRQ